MVRATGPAISRNSAWSAGFAGARPSTAPRKKNGVMTVATLATTSASIASTTRVFTALSPSGQR